MHVPEFLQLANLLLHFLDFALSSKELITNVFSHLFLILGPQTLLNCPGRCTRSSLRPWPRTKATSLAITKVFFELLYNSLLITALVVSGSPLGKDMLEFTQMAFSGGIAWESWKVRSAVSLCTRIMRT